MVLHQMLFHSTVSLHGGSRQELCIWIFLHLMILLVLQFLMMSMYERKEYEVFD